MCLISYFKYCFLTIFLYSNEMTLGVNMTISIENIQKIKDLVKSNYKEHFGSDESLRLFPDLEKIYEWENEANIERLCFNCGPSKNIKHENIKYETELKNVTYKVEGRADVLLTTSKGFINPKQEQKEKIFCIIENKLAFSYQEVSSQIDEAVNQVNNYIKLFDVSEEYILHNEFFVSVCIFNPLTFLKAHDPYLNYLNDKYSTQEQKYDKYGILILTLKVQKDGNRIYPNILKNTQTNIIPTVIELKGNLNLKEHFLDKDNFTMSVQFLELSKLPLTNVNPSSKINNPREYIEDSPANKTRRIRIFKTMESLYQEDQNTRSRSLGAKNREIGYDINETIMFNLPYKYEDTGRKFLFQDVLVIVTTNMSLIDGQHSTKAFFDLYKNRFGELSMSKYGENNFKQNMSEYYFGLNFKGYNKVDLALNAAINQNNIAKQTRLDEILLEYRDYIIRLANFYNGASSYILNFNKSSYNLDKIETSKIIWSYYFTYIWGVLDEPVFNNETFKNTSHSKTTPSQSSGNNLRNSIKWVFEDHRSDDLINMEKIIAKYIKKLDFNNTEINNINNEIEKNNYNTEDDQFQYNDEDELLNGLQNHINEISDKKIDTFNIDIKQNIYALKRAFQRRKKDDINDIIEDLYVLLTEELKIKTTLLNNIMLVLGEVKNKYNVDEKMYKIKVVMTMWILRLQFQYDKDKFENTLLKKQDILNCFDILEKNKLLDLIQFENYIKPYIK